MGHTVECGLCGTHIEPHDEGGASALIEVACWSCDTVNVVNRFRMEVVEVA